MTDLNVPAEQNIDLGTAATEVTRNVKMLILCKHDPVCCARTPEEAFPTVQLTKNMRRKLACYV